MILSSFSKNKIAPKNHSHKFQSLLRKSNDISISILFFNFWLIIKNLNDYMCFLTCDDKNNLKSVYFNDVFNFSSKNNQNKSQ
jgi:hypothetical protein